MRATRFPFGSAGVKKINVAIENVVYGVALQTANFDGFFFLLVHHTGAFAENFRRANAAATMSENIGFESCASGAAEIVGGDFLYERRDVNVRWAGDSAGRVKAEKAAGGFDGGLARGHPRRNFREIPFVLLGRKLGGRLAQRHELAVVSLCWKRDAVVQHQRLAGRSIDSRSSWRSANPSEVPSSYSSFLVVSSISDAIDWF